MSDENRIPLRNPEGYMDLTTHDALTNVMRETEEADLRCNRLIIAILKNPVNNHQQ